MSMTYYFDTMTVTKSLLAIMITCIVMSYTVTAEVPGWEARFNALEASQHRTAGDLAKEINQRLTLEKNMRLVRKGLSHEKQMRADLEGQLLTLKGVLKDQQDMLQKAVENITSSCCVPSSHTKIAHKPSIHCASPIGNVSPPFNHGTEVYYQNKLGYRLLKSKTAKCSYGVFIHVPQCQAVYCPEITMSSLHKHLLIKNPRNKYEHGTNASFLCKPGYSLSADYPQHWRCYDGSWQNDGKKSPAYPKCVPAEKEEDETEEEPTGATVVIQTGQRVLPTEPVVSKASGEICGTRFGLAADSRHEYNKLPSSFRRRGQFSVDFRTTVLHGLIFYAADRRYHDFISLYMLNGHVNYAFNCGTGATILLSSDKHNDGEWHHVIFVRRRNEGTLQIDDNVIATGRSRGRSSSITVDPPFFVGGLSAEAITNAKANIGSIATKSFVGCINNFRLNELELGPPVDAVGVQKCYKGLEPGTFFYADGGFITLYDNFIVGINMDVSLDIKPRSMYGVLIAVHSDKGPRADFFLMQLVDGENLNDNLLNASNQHLRDTNPAFVLHHLFPEHTLHVASALLVTTDNGGGEFTATFKPSSNNTLCDGRWHTVKASKAKNVLTISVDGVMGTAGVGATGVSFADTNHPLYIGGIPADRVNRGVRSEEQYVGCVRNLVLNNMLQYLYSETLNGHVQVDACPMT